MMTLGSGNMSLAVELPNGEELNEWLAVNTIEFYNEISILYGTLTEVLAVPPYALVLHLRDLLDHVGGAEVRVPLG